MEQQIKFMVCVRCMTFNHAPYIVDAMNGFTMQQTAFPFVCVIIDDASTDGEPDIIRKYIEEHFDLKDHIVIRNEETDDYVLNFAQHKTNKNCYFAVLFLKYNHYSIKKSKMQYIAEWNEQARYIALCEGDDYWISPHKLQCQVDFLETHPSHSLCFHANYAIKRDGTKVEVRRYNEDHDKCEMERMIKGGGFISTESMLYLRKHIEDYPEWARNAPVGDAPLMLVLAERGYVGYINQIMGCYRIGVEGSWTVRMSKSWKMRIETLLKIIQYKKGFDEWSGYKYHKYVRKALFDSYVSFVIKSIPFAPSIIKIGKKIKKKLKFKK